MSNPVKWNQSWDCLISSAVPWHSPSTLVRGHSCPECFRGPSSFPFPVTRVVRYYSSRRVTEITEFTRRRSFGNLNWEVSEQPAYRVAQIKYFFLLKNRYLYFYHFVITLFLNQSFYYELNLWLLLLIKLKQAWIPICNLFVLIYVML